jgi:zinc transport system permease protein
LAERLVNSLAKMMVVSFFISLIFMLSGLGLAYAFDLSSGAAVIAIASGTLFTVLAAQQLLRRLKATSS